MRKNNTSSLTASNKRSELLNVINGLSDFAEVLLTEDGEGDMSLIRLIAGDVSEILGF